MEETTWVSLLSDDVHSRRGPAVTLDWTLGLSNEQDHKIHVPIARRKEGWAFEHHSATVLGHGDSSYILSPVGEKSL